MTEGEQAATTTGPGGGEPWFSGRREDVLLYQVNRRMRDAPTLGAEQPESVLDHAAEVLLFGEPVTTGAKNQREWRLGNRDIDLENRTISGQIGWQSSSETATDRYDEEANAWVDDVSERGRAARAPFVFDSDSRTLGVLKHRSFGEKVVSDVFTRLFNLGEDARSIPFAEWSVEPILDEQTFTEWLRQVDAVQRVTFTARAPNPDGLDEFGEVWERMQARQARLIRETMEADNPETGLQGIEEDPVLRGYIAMGKRAYGYVLARGRRRGRATTFDQRNQVARRQTDELPSSWSDAVGSVRAIVFRRRGASRDQNSS